MQAMLREDSGRESFSIESKVLTWKKGLRFH